MNLDKLNNKKLCILGLGIENYALIKFLLSQKIPCNITICDTKQNIKKTELSTGSLASLASLKWRLGKKYDQNLGQFDIIFRSPGYPLFTKEIKEAKKAGAEISSPMKLFFEFCPTNNIIGVTGTKGKGTTASLIYHILKKSAERRHNAFLGGNIGIAPFSFINKIKKNDWVILELSSFQLEDMAVSPPIALITNFVPEHLAPADPNNPNYHRSMRDYWKAKSNIFRWQGKNGRLIANVNLKNKFTSVISTESALKVKNRIIYFTKSDLPSKLVGEYNKENIAAAVAAAKLIGVGQNTIKKATASFKGLEHRLELTRTFKSIKYFNNSLATTPQSVIADLESFREPIILIVGGADKGASFKNLAQEIKKKVKFVILLTGQATPKIKKELLKVKYHNKKMLSTKNMAQAVKAASKNSLPNDIVLLSPACASFGMFKNYKERGEIFKREVRRLK